MAEHAGQLDMFGGEATGNEGYERFVKKFTETPKTTDDCYTPENVYRAIAEWVCAEYGVRPGEIVRPFWPGEDYRAREYPAGCCVVDNPPFSIITQICRYYIGKGVRFFLFAPTLTLFSARDLDVSYIPCGASITYENKAKVNTSFITNLDSCRVRSAPALYQAVKRENDVNERAARANLPRYSYPDNVLTAAAASQYSHYGVEYRLEKGDSVFIAAMDAQRGVGKGIFGGGFLLSERAAAERAAAERAAAERAAAERAAAHKWELSERELEIVRKLSGGGVSRWEQEARRNEEQRGHGGPVE